MDASMSEREMRAMKLEALRERDGGLPQRQEELHAALNRIGKHLEELESRLQPVLRDPEPQSDVLQATPRMPESPLGGFLRGAASHADELTHRLEELLGRVDL